MDILLTQWGGYLVFITNTFTLKKIVNSTLKNMVKKNGRVYQNYLGTFLKNANVQTLLFLSKDPDVFLMSIHF